MVNGWADVEEAVMSCVRVVGTNSVGSGFLYRIPFGKDNTMIGIITNKHVIVGQDSLRITLPFGKNGVEYTLVGMKEECTFHSDVDVDLVFIPITNVVQDIFNNTGSIPNIKLLSKENLLLPTDYDFLNVIENILVMGYPNGLWDSENYRPLIRTGITASDPRLDYQGKKEFIIDAEIIGGSSGSPVFISLSVNDYSRLDSIPEHNRVVKILGVNRAVFIREHQGELTQVTSNVILKGVPIGLGVCIKSEEILNLENQVIEKYKNKKLPGNYKWI